MTCKSARSGVGLALAWLGCAGSADTTTLTDRQFLIGTRDGPRATIAAELRVPGAPGDTTRLPAIVMMLLLERMRG